MLNRKGCHSMYPSFICFNARDILDISLHNASSFLASPSIFWCISLFLVTLEGRPLLSWGIMMLERWIITSSLLSLILTLQLCFPRWPTKVAIRPSTFPYFPPTIWTLSPCFNMVVGKGGKKEKKGKKRKEVRPNRQLVRPNRLL